MDLAVDCFALTERFPKSELFGSVSQIRNCSASIPANIAEGWGRNGGAELARFCDIAQGSRTELETHLILANRRGLSSHEEVDPLLHRADEVGRMLFAFAKSVRTPSG
jgi:four helix bundle protein